MLKTVIVSLQVGFTGNFVPDSPLKLCFWQFKLSHSLSHLLYQILWCFFRFLDRKFNEDFKNILKIVIFSLQVGFTGGFATDCPFKLCF